MHYRRGDRAVEGARLEIVCTPNKGTGGSNPPLSAIFTYEKHGQSTVFFSAVQEKSVFLNPLLYGNCTGNNETD
jgi:hypothetical protein